MGTGATTFVGGRDQATKPPRFGLVEGSVVTDGDRSFERRIAVNDR